MRAGGAAGREQGGRRVTRMEADERVRAAQEAERPPGGFDAWLHLLAAPVVAADEGPGLQGSSASPAADRDGHGGVSGSPEGDEGRGEAGPAAGEGGRVWAEVISLTAPNDPDEPLALFFIDPERVAERLARQLAAWGQRCAAIPGCAGLVVQAGISGMECRALAPAPTGFIPRYRLPRRFLPEPVWAVPEPLWCPRERLLEEPERIAGILVDGLRQQLEGT